MVWPDQSNHHGTLFGGSALAMLDRIAFILGSKVLRGPVVTASVGQLDFIAPPAEPPPPADPATPAPTAPADGMACATVAEIVFPGHANHRGVLHGGPAMAWISKAGFVAATRQVRRTLVMAASERIDFKAPAHVGDVVEVTATVTGLGRRSIQVRAEMWAESPVSGERRHCTSAELVYVAVGD